MPFPFSTIDEGVQQIRSGATTCRATVEQSIETINAGDGLIHAFISVDAGRAIERAAELDALSQAEKARMPLLGMPVAVKDNICTRGQRTTCASKMLEHFVPPYDATVVESLHNAGAVIVGKTNMDEFAMGSSNETSYFGGTRNPRDVTRTPGGSSGGSAAAVAAGFVAAALGSDTGGSIRQPCGHCGVVGLTPTYGMVSRYGLVAFASSLDQIGPIVSNVRDAGRMLSVISGADARDATCAGKPFTATDDIYKNDIAGLRIGLPREYFGGGLSDEVRRPIEKLTERLRDRGAVLLEVSLPTLRYAIAAYYIMCTAEASSNLARYDGVRYGFRSPQRSLPELYRETRRQGFGAEVKRRIMLGTYVLSHGYYDAYYLKAAKVRTLIRNDFNDAFGSCDLIMSPVAPTCAFKIGEKSDDPLQMYLTDIYTVSASLAGIPGLSVPCGAAGVLPVGVQFMAPQWREDVLLKAGYAVECLGGG
ncbi:MAG: Asp-tRNA(Asn)/Glu-tRNA(Gln) amidotransferase subunit GatA [Chitinispirillaceae bacterium]|nr:Asp-tRNA(Asn)/Glu-tRNA(Gln) amidotransferase subunit GatA [Chitinispirillaceae bacterium]